MVPLAGSVVSARNSDHPDRAPTLPLGADAAMLAPRALHASHASQSTRRRCRTAASSIAAEIFGFSSEMSGHMITMMGQWQSQADAQRIDAQAREQALLKMVEANTSLQREKLKFNMNRELEFQQIQEKEKERAIAAQQKLRELASQELKERISLEKELSKQQQQNLLLQKQS